MTAKKRGLGRGLNALIGDVSSVTREHSEQTLPVEKLQRGKYQPRKDIDPDRLQELADSISAQGIIQPVVVRPVDGDRYEIIAGERRWRAAQIAGLHDIPVLIRDVADQAVMALGLIENIQREDLNPLEEAEALDRLLNEFEMTHQQVADAVGKSRSTVSNLMRLMDLPSEIKGYLVRGEIEMGHARALLGLDGSVQMQAAQKIVAAKMTVRAAEKLVKSLQLPESGPAKKAPMDPDVERLRNQISERLGARVSIQHKNSGKGKVVINYTTLEELEGVLERIK